MLLLICLIIFIILIIGMILKVKRTLNKFNSNELDSKSATKINELSQNLLDEVNKRKF